MRNEAALVHKFVEYIPETLDEGTIYVSLTFATAVHLCCCGCGNDVITPLSPTDWKLIFDGETISLHPSIGNWNFSCRSHYWIKHNQVEWTRQWSDEEIYAGRFQDMVAKEKYFNNEMKLTNQNTFMITDKTVHISQKAKIWQKLKKWLF